MSGYNYSKKRAAEKGSRSLALTEQTQQTELQQKRAFRRAADMERHYVVRVEEKGSSYTRFWRSSQIKANPREFCRQAGMLFDKKTGFNTLAIRTYLRRNQRQPAQRA